jgi:hypothetical protein
MFSVRRATLMRTERDNGERIEREVQPHAA